MIDDRWYEGYNFSDEWLRYILRKHLEQDEVEVDLLTIYTTTSEHDLCKSSCGCVVNVMDKYCHHCWKKIKHINVQEHIDNLS